MRAAQKCTVLACISVKSSVSSWYVASGNEWTICLVTKRKSPLEGLVCVLVFRNEFKAYTDVKPIKSFKAQSQYKAPTEEKASLETSYSATYKGEQVKAQPTDNKVQERRRIRSLYNEPGKEPTKVSLHGQTPMSLLCFPRVLVCLIFFLHFPGFQMSFQVLVAMRGQLI